MKKLWSQTLYWKEKMKKRKKIFYVLTCTGFVLFLLAIFFLQTADKISQFISIAVEADMRELKGFEDLA